MFRLNAHQRKFVASLALGGWLFAFFVGVVHACGFDAEPGPLQQTVIVSPCSHDQGDKGALPDCKQFCADDLPVLAKLQSIQDQPGGNALLPPSSDESLLVRVAWVQSPLHRVYPLPDIALNTRFVRLAL
jgi:hypothetical protein